MRPKAMAIFSLCAKSACSFSSSSTSTVIFDVIGE
uniref:Uncharacterized protein n=1 Tax=Arundo donax TaxID=35708 RepID=A0A0A9FE30_ARUDO